jgi:SHS2 domain-containing protein
LPPFDIQDHTADVRLHVTGRDQIELFTSAVEGLVAVMDSLLPPLEIHEDLPFKVTAPDQESLLVDFLNEALFTMQSRKVVVGQVVFRELESTCAEGDFTIAPVTGFAEDVKAVTYHDLRIIRTSEGRLETIIVLDI